MPFDKDRVVAVDAARRGSGYFITDLHIVTAKHLLAPNRPRAPIHVHRKGSGTPDVATVAYAPPDRDVAVLRVAPSQRADGAPSLPVRLAVRFGKASGLKLSVHLMGFPEFQERRSAGTRVLNPEHVFGVLTPGTSLALGDGKLFAIHVATSTPRSTPASADGVRTSPWAGTSGAAVFSDPGDILLGVIVVHTDAEGNERLMMAALEDVVADQEFRNGLHVEGEQPFRLTTCEDEARSPAIIDDVRLQRRLDDLKGRVLSWSGVSPGKAERCLDTLASLREEALQTDREDVAEQAILLSGFLLVRSQLPNGERRGQVRDQLYSLRDRGLNNASYASAGAAACFTLAKLCQMIAASERDGDRRITALVEAISLLDRVKQKTPLPYDIALPGVDSETDRGVSSVRDASINFVPVPYRYRSACLAALGHAHLRKATSGAISAGAKVLERAGQEGKTIRAARNSRVRLNIELCHAMARLVRHAWLHDVGGDPGFEMLKSRILDAELPMPKKHEWLAHCSAGMAALSPSERDSHLREMMGEMRACLKLYPGAAYIFEADPTFEIAAGSREALMECIRSAQDQARRDLAGARRA